jgi:3-methyladenine DNA glycosylase AlkD
VQVSRFRYWEWAANFGIFHLANSNWRQPLVDVLLCRTTSTPDDFAQIGTTQNENRMNQRQAIARQVKQALTKLANPEKAEFFPNFFQATPGGYGEGDRFLGVIVPDQRKVAGQFCDLARNELDRLLADPFHECRLTAVLILVDQFKRARKSAERKDIVDWLLARTTRINNWDIVDSCAPQILGEFLKTESDRSLLKRLVKSRNVWEQRMAIVANLPLIKQGEFAHILEFAERLLDHPHDLIHKAVGWMLRELGKKNRQVLIGFLDKSATRMPRTMLRYAIEKFPDPMRKKYLNKKRQD